MCCSFTLYWCPWRHCCCVAKMVNNASTDTPLLLPPWHQIVKIPRKKLSTLSDGLRHKSNFWLTRPPPVKWGRTLKTRSWVGGRSHPWWQEVIDINWAAKCYTADQQKKAVGDRGLHEKCWYFDQMFSLHRLWLHHHHHRRGWKCLKSSPLPPFAPLNA